MPIAAVGLVCGLIGFRRERPPLLPIVGVPICVSVFCWYYVVVGFTYVFGFLSLGLLLVVIFGPFFQLPYEIGRFFLQFLRKK